MKAGEKLYHENHFVCVVCSTSLKTVPVYTKNDQLYCEADYMSKFVPVCARCEQYITQVERNTLLTININISICKSKLNPI